MKDLQQLLLQRRSIRKFTPEKISGDDVKYILEAALVAPTGKNRRPCEFIIIEDEAMLKRLSVAKEHGAKLIEKAPLAIVVIGDAMRSDTWVEDASIACTLMQLACEEKGLGSCWVHMINRLNETGNLASDLIKQWLEIPDHYGVLAVIAIGHKDEEKKPYEVQELPWEKVHVDQFRN